MLLNTRTHAQKKETHFLQTLWAANVLLVLVWFPCFMKGREDIPRPCYNCITASDPSIGIETKLLKPIPISINSHADTFIPIQKLIAQIFVKKS